MHFMSAKTPLVSGLGKLYLIKSYSDLAYFQCVCYHSRNLKPNKTLTARLLNIA